MNLVHVLADLWSEMFLRGTMVFNPTFHQTVDSTHPLYKILNVRIVHFTKLQWYDRQIRSMRAEINISMVCRQHIVGSTANVVSYNGNFSHIFLDLNPSHAGASSNSPAYIQTRGVYSRRSCRVLWTCFISCIGSLVSWSYWRRAWKSISNVKETWHLKKMYDSCTDPSYHNWLPDFLLVRQNSFTTYPINCQNKLVLAAWIRT